MARDRANKHMEKNGKETRGNRPESVIKPNWYAGQVLKEREWRTRELERKAKKNGEPFVKSKTAILEIPTVNNVRDV